MNYIQRIYDLLVEAKTTHVSARVVGDDVVGNVHKPGHPSPARTFSHKVGSKKGEALIKATGASKGSAGIARPKARK